MKALLALIKRNTLIFFKDKGAFFTAMISPLILLMLYAVFLDNVFVQSFNSAVEEAGVTVSNKLVRGYVGGWELSSLLSVCCVTVPFVANAVVVEDKSTGAFFDLTITPVKRYILAISYYITTAIITLIICYTAMLVGFGYLGITGGWTLRATDVIRIIGDVFIIALFGTALSSIVCNFLSSQGGVTAISVIVSSCYGFICGAYYPISQFSKAIQNVIVCLPGTYGTSLLRNHFLQSVMDSFSAECNFPLSVTETMRDNFDINLYFFGHKVGLKTMFLIVLFTVIILITALIILSMIKFRRGVLAKLRAEKMYKQNKNLEK